MKTIFVLMSLLLIGGMPVEKQNYETFLNNPTRYTFKCGCDVGAVTSATLDGEDMAINYYYPCNGETRKGFLKGKYNKMSNTFKGIYNTENKSFYGEINFSFNDKGEALGTWGNGVGKVYMKLKNDM